MALAGLVHAYQTRMQGYATTESCVALARTLASLMDEAEQSGVDLGASLRDLVPEAHAAHWATTVTFLRIVTDAWPAWLADRGLMNPAARAAALLRAQAEEWRKTPPLTPVWVAGVTSALPEIANLLRVVAGLPSGLVVLPGLDATLDDAAWDALGPGHPQSGMSRLLAGMGAVRGDVEPWGEPNVRERLFATALLPPRRLNLWDEPVDPPANLFRLAAADAGTEAAAIALVLRDALETPGARAALVTPDRTLAVRVAAELGRFGIVADDSAGEPLAHAPPGVFLRLLAEATDADLSPVALLSLLKHPVAAAGLSARACRDLTRRLERAVLRGPAPPPGFAGLRGRLDGARGGGDPTLAAFLERVLTCLEPALRPAPPPLLPAAGLMAGLIEAAEALAATDTASGPSRLWAGEEGVALAELLGEALPALDHLPPMPASERVGLLDALLEGRVAHGRRALRGRDVTAEHPRVFIWGLLEARLQSVDVVVLGGLADGTWPPATDPGPWLSRPMRAAAGLPDVDEAIGRAAHDFVQAACSAPICVLSAPARRDGAPVIEARWLARLSALLRKHSCTLPAHPAAAWAAMLGAPIAHTPVAAPHPCPAVAARPTRLSVSDVQTLICDPYAIYARKILGLRELDPLEQETDAADYGSILHDGMHRLYERLDPALPAETNRLAVETLGTALLDAGLRGGLRAWWAPQFDRIAHWVVAEERRRRAEMVPDRIATEIAGELKVPNLDFILTARVDRIERSGGAVAILDYKTGTVPSKEQVENGSRPQLPLEAVMAECGAFGPEFQHEVREMTYWRLTGGHDAGKPVAAVKDARFTIEEASGHLHALLEGFQDPARTYPHCPHPGRKAASATYAQLARMAEVAGAEDGNEDGDGNGDDAE